MIEKFQGVGEFITGLSVAGIGGALLLWGTVASNRADIENIKEDVQYVRERLDTLIDLEIGNE